jgi:hypothetical protein
MLVREKNYFHKLLLDVYEGPQISIKRFQIKHTAHKNMRFLLVFLFLGGTGVTFALPEPILSI